MKKLALSLIKFYQKYLSLDQGALRKFVLSGQDRPDFKICRFQPTCSEYTYQAIDKYGVIKGTIKGCYRVVRCNPFTKGGFDPVR